MVKTTTRNGHRYMPPASGSTNAPSGETQGVRHDCHIGQLPQPRLLSTTLAASVPSSSSLLALALPSRNLLLLKEDVFPPLPSCCTLAQKSKKCKRQSICRVMLRTPKTVIGSDGSVLSRTPPKKREREEFKQQYKLSLEK